MTKDQQQTAQIMKSGTSDKSLGKQQKAKRVQIPGEDEGFDAPIIDPTKFGQKIDDGSLKAEELVEKFEELAKAPEVEETVSLESKAKTELTLEQLYKMVQDLQTRGGPNGDLELAWASAMTSDQKNVEVSQVTYAQLTRSMKVKPSSVWYKDVRFFPEGTMEEVLSKEGLNVDFIRGISNRQTSSGRFKGRT